LVKKKVEIYLILFSNIKAFLHDKQHNH